MASPQLLIRMKVNIIVLALSAYLSLFGFPYVVALDQDQCLEELNSGHLRNLTSDNRSLGLDNFGHPVSDANATAISYFDCVEFCPGGMGQEPFSWSMFTQQFAAWMLPWIALLSQLPFGAESKWDDLMSVLLTVGSPVLAGYSIVLTTLNDSYLASSLTNTPFPNVEYAISVLSSLQQAPLHITTEGGLLASLVVLSQNDKWWETIPSLIGREHMWSISAFSGMAWVIIAYVLTIIDAFADINPSRKYIPSDGPGVSSVWVWLLPVVAGWLIISPKTEASKLLKAVREGNKLAYAAQDNSLPYSPSLSPVNVNAEYGYAIALKRAGTTLLYDEVCSPPVFNYARHFYWASGVDHVVDVFHAASAQVQSHIPVDSMHKWTHSIDVHGIGTVHPDNRQGSREQVVEYCRFPSGQLQSVWGRRVFVRLAIASLMGLALQWCTAVAAAVIVMYSSSAGLGCRSGSYLLYALTSSLVWLSMVLSSIFAYYCDTAPQCKQRKVGSPSYPPHPFLRELALALNILGKGLATLNAFWLLCTCMLHFSNTFNRCICNGGVWGARSAKDSYAILTYSVGHQRLTKYIWIGGVAMTFVSATLFVGFVWVKRQTPRRKKGSSRSMAV